VLQVYAGLLPARSAGTTDLANREVIHDHGAAGGPKGLFSISGVKFTTARLVAEKTLCRLYGRSLPPARPDATRPPGLPDLGGQNLRDTGSPLDRPAGQVRALVDQESVLCLDDLLLRRMDSTHAARDRSSAAARARSLLGWDQDRSTREMSAGQRVGTGVSPR
jgi:glycerol-3-phosphate dehydrogenase